jgi:sphinganine-1-phosphate aldolase
VLGLRCSTWVTSASFVALNSAINSFLISGYLESARSIVSAAKKIEKAIRDDIPELYILGKPPGSVVAFASQHPRVNALEVGDAMSKRGWHLNGLSNPPAVHIACTVSAVSPCFDLV